MKPLLAAALLAAQASLPQFDVASIKLNQRLEQPANNWTLAPGRTDYHNSQVIQLIKAAWGDFSLPVENGPQWINSDRYDVVGQHPAAATREVTTLMLRHLLMDRFKLAAHLETRQIPIYSLRLARSDRRLGPKLTQGDAECAPNGRSNPPASCGRGVSVGRGSIDFAYYDMATLARILSSMPAVGRRVENNTGLEGGYKIELAFAPAQATDSDAPSIFTALQEQLGLKLEDSRGDGRFLVIDHIDRPTPE